MSQVRFAILAVVALCIGGICGAVSVTYVGHTPAEAHDITVLMLGFLAPSILALLAYVRAADARDEVERLKRKETDDD